MQLLCLEGGGVRGVLQARLLERLQNERPFLDRMDSFAGASIGVVTAMWIATERPIEDLVGVYRKAAPFVFGAKGFLARHAHMALRTTLQHYLGSLRLRDLKRPVLSYALGKDGPRFFDPLRSADADELVVDVVLAATAAMPALPAHKGLVDGGALASDPSQVALEWVGPHNVSALLAVGTGSAPIRGGFLASLAGAAIRGQQCAVSVACRSALGARYHKAQAQLQRAIGLDEASAIDELLQVADAWDTTETVRWLRENMR